MNTNNIQYLKVCFLIRIISYHYWGQFLIGTSKFRIYPEIALMESEIAQNIFGLKKILTKIKGN